MSNADYAGAFVPIFGGIVVGLVLGLVGGIKLATHWWLDRCMAAALEAGAEPRRYMEQLTFQAGLLDRYRRARKEAIASAREKLKAEIEEEARSA